MPRFTPPTHEEPMRTLVRPLRYFRLTWAKSVVKINGVYQSTRNVDTTTAGVEGVDYFLGGKQYVIDDATATALTADGYTVTPDAGYGIGPYGHEGFGY